MKLVFLSALLTLGLLGSQSVVLSQMKPNEKRLLEGAQKAFLSGNFDTAIATLDDLLKRYPRNNAAFYLRGNIKLFFRRDLDGAFADLQAALRFGSTAPGVEKVYNDLGLIHQFRGEDKQALEYFEKAINKNPLYAPPHNGRAVLLEKKGQIDEALKEFDKFIQLDSNSIAGYVGRSDIRLKRHDINGALEDATKVVEGDQQFPSSWLRRGFIFCVLGRWESCVSDLRKGFELSKQPQHMFSRIDISFADFEKFTEIYPNETNAFAGRGFVELFRNNDERAASLFKQAYKLDPSLELKLAELVGYVRQVRK